MSNETEQKSKPEVSLKKAIITGVIIDLLLWLFSSMIMDFGVISFLTSCVLVCHWIANVFIILYKKAGITRRYKYLIRYGLLMATPVIYVVGEIFQRPIYDFIRMIFK
jgi:hypothetical protein